MEGLGLVIGDGGIGNIFHVQVHVRIDSQYTNAYTEIYYVCNSVDGKILPMVIDFWKYIMYANPRTGIYSVCTLPQCVIQLRGQKPVFIHVPVLHEHYCLVQGWR